MAVLEAFVYDPLLNWRLMDVTHGKEAAKKKEAEGAAVEEDASKDLEIGSQKEFKSDKALAVVSRVRDKLTGKDFSSSATSLEVKEQVTLLAEQATSVENLCQLYIGWCPFW